MFTVAQTTDFIDSQVFIDYARSLGTLRPPSIKRIHGW
jgi:hypothetical protein